LIPLPQLIFSLVENGQPVTLGMRREAVNVSTELASTKGIQLRGEVEAFESDYVHRTQTVQIRTGRWHYSGLCPIDQKLWIGQPIQVQINPQQLYFFDTNSGKRL
jgi:ABC-type sugar transport system ATPase subunit